MDVTQTLSDIRKRLMDASKDGGAARRLVRDLFPLFERLEEQLGVVKKGRTRVREGEGVEYVVEQSALGETLAEHRLSGKSKPFRCPKAVYEAMVAVLAGSAVPMSVSQITEAVAARIGSAPGEFQVRVALRMWLSIDPPLVIRNRARYRASHVDGLAEKANDHWGRLASHQ